MVIWKFLLEVADVQAIEMPKGAEILTVQTQMEHPHIWALVNPDAETEHVSIYTVGTGYDATHLVYRRHIGTYQLYNGGLVFHVFV